MNRKLRITAASLVAAVALGVAAPAASAATQESAPRVAVTQTAGGNQAGAATLSPSMAKLVSEAQAASANADTKSGSNQVAPKGWWDKLKKKALKKAFSKLPKKWQKKIKSWAKKGYKYLRAQLAKLPKPVRWAITLGGSITLKNAAEWLIDILF
ncbi:hypothetical protein ACFQVC_24570 [Streptomyces monticola]|uniref:Lytic transglycosylase domain-containing protein n=1 Tax=Streptomyces monticola TaxID=2666263 RepID=A0ABW2JPR1_9ACTN